MWIVLEKYMKHIGQAYAGLQPFLLYQVEIYRTSLMENLVDSLVQVYYFLTLLGFRVGYAVDCRQPIIQNLQFNFITNTFNSIIEFIYILNYLEKGRMRTKIYLITVLYLLVLHSSQLSIDSNDLMNGDGLFLNQSITDFSLAQTHFSSFLTANSVNVLRIEKPANESVSYSSGLTYSFTSSTPKHISFQFASTNPDTEDSNLRLVDSNSGKSLLLFRAGKGGLIRVNQKQMVSFYNDSVSTDSSIKLTKIDLKVDWTNKEIEIFVGDSFKEKCQFFNSQVTKVDQVLIYNLYQSTSYWSNLVICSQVCYSFSSESSLLFVLSALMLVIVNLF